MVATVGYPLLWVVKLVSAAQLETETQIRKFKEELRLEDMWLSTTMLVLGLENKVGKKNNKFEPLCAVLQK